MSISTNNSAEIKFSCPHCQQHISTGSESAGLETQCPTCGGDITIPAAPSEQNDTEASQACSSSANTGTPNKNSAKKKISMRNKLLMTGAIFTPLLIGAFIKLTIFENNKPNTSEEEKDPIIDPFTNSLGMKFSQVNIPTGPSAKLNIYFSIWETRRMDYANFVNDSSIKGLNSQWKDHKDGAPKGFNNPLSPVIFVNQQDAKAFCRWLTKKERSSGLIPEEAKYRLPTDHEWSCAVGIGTEEDPYKQASSKSSKISDIYPWGRLWPIPKDVGNVNTNNNKLEYMGLAKVGSYKPGKFGLYDMAGNVSEIVTDPNSRSKSAIVSRGSAWISPHPPRKEEHNSSTRYILDLANVPAGLLSNRTNDNGFRCVLEVKGSNLGNEQEAINRYRKAADQGNADAKFNLGRCYSEGVGNLQANEQEAIKWYRQAADQGHAQAQYELGSYIYNRLGARNNEQKEAVDWFNKAAAQGNAEAQYQLGLCYGSGTGVKKDIAKSLAWYMKAADQGHEIAKILIEAFNRELNTK